MAEQLKPQLIILDATAGSGKTKKAFQYAESWVQEGSNVLYAAYNTSVKDEGTRRATKINQTCRRTGSKIESLTMHSVALSAERKRLQDQHVNAKLLNTSQTPYSRFYKNYVMNKIVGSLEEAREQGDSSALFWFIHDELALPQLVVEWQEQWCWQDIEEDIRGNATFIWQHVEAHSMTDRRWPDAYDMDHSSSRHMAYARIFWWLVQQGQVVPTFDSLLRLAGEFPDSLLKVTAQYQYIILDEAHDMNDAGILMFHSMLQTHRRGLIAFDKHQEIYPFLFCMRQLFLHPPGGMLVTQVPLQQTYRFGNPLAERVQAMVQCKDPSFELRPTTRHTTQIIAADANFSFLPCYKGLLVLGRTHAALLVGLYKMFRHAHAPKYMDWLGQGKIYEQKLEKLAKYAAEENDQRERTGERLAVDKAQGWENDESFSLWSRVPEFGDTADERQRNVMFLQEKVKEAKSGKKCDILAATVHQAKGSEADRVLVLPGFLREGASRCNEKNVCYVASTRAKRKLYVQCPELLEALGGVTPAPENSEPSNSNSDWFRRLQQQPGCQGEGRGNRRPNANQQKKRQKCD